MHWTFTGLLIGASGATAVYTLWLVRRLFTTEPVADPEPIEGRPVEQRSVGPADGVVAS